MWCIEHMNKTNWLIILCVLASVLSWLYANEQNIEYVAFSGENLLRGRIWTIFTSLFLHSDLTHLIGNMIFLYIFGNTLENELGEKWILLPFFIGGAGSFLLSTFFYEPIILLIGASAAIFTLTAIIMLLKPLKFSFFFLMPLGLVALIYFTYNLLAVYSGSPGNISYIGHIIGFSIGVPFGIVSSKDWHKNLLTTGGLFVIYLLIMWILMSSIGIFK
jgi:membrane associated rhomboid family serine protease